MARDDTIEFKGRVEAELGGGVYAVKVTGVTGHDHMVRATLSGKMRQHKIRVIMGDSVLVEVSPYDLSEGRITFRERG